MRQIALAVAATVLAACAHVPSAQSAVGQSAPAPARGCSAATGPVIVVDGVVQPPTCDAGASTSNTSCRAGAPIYVVDGVRTCGKP
jgi:hypothetical protein